MPELRRAVVTDVDNTLYNFVDFFGPAFRAMLHVLMRETRLPEDELLESFRDLYAEHGTLEYRESIQRLKVIRTLGLSQEEIHKTLVRPSVVAFSQSRQKRLHPYPGVADTLRQFSRDGYFVVAYSDGLANYTLNRLRALGILGYFDLLVARESGALRRSKVVVRTFCRGEEKPNPKLLKSILDEYRIAPERSWMVGDSPAKDLWPAREIGVRDAWARYGREYDPGNWETLVRVSPWSAPMVSSESDKEPEFSPSVVVNSFDELKSIVPRLQLQLF